MNQELEKLWLKFRTTKKCQKLVEGPVWDLAKPFYSNPFQENFDCEFPRMLEREYDDGTKEDVEVDMCDFLGHLWLESTENKRPQWYLDRIRKKLEQEIVGHYDCGAVTYMDCKRNEGTYSGAVELCFNIAALSTALYYLNPEAFCPLLLDREYLLFTEICRELGITLPDPPSKSNWLQRLGHYWELNARLQKYRHKNDLTQDELMVKLYHFCPKHVQTVHPPGVTLPDPKNVWMVIGGAMPNQDHQYLASVDRNSISNWHGHREMQIGDIVLMYQAAPYTRFHSFWRVVEHGHVNPFFYYYQIGKIAYPIVLSDRQKIPFSEMRRDGTGISWFHSVRGSSGNRIPEAAFAVIERQLRIRGFSFSGLPLPAGYGI